jgi:hypothetical protein
MQHFQKFFDQSTLCLKRCTKGILGTLVTAHPPLSPFPFILVTSCKSQGDTKEQQGSWAPQFARKEETESRIVCF